MTLTARDLTTEDRVAAAGARMTRALTDIAIAQADVTRRVLDDLNITYDTALPQAWVDDVVLVTKMQPYGIVWLYPEDSIWGMPFAVTAQGGAILARYNTLKKEAD